MICEAERNTCGDPTCRWCYPPRHKVLGMRRITFDKWRNRLLTLLMWAVIMAAIAFSAYSCDRAHAMDHGFDYSDPVVRWFNALPRPNMRSTSCCGKGDAYGADEYEKVGDHYRVTITDGEYKQFPDGTVRAPLKNGTVVDVPLVFVNPPSDGNPTGHGVIFLSVSGGDVLAVWCFVLPSMGS